MYNKIFTKILDSSIWLETHPTRIVWFTFLAAMDEHGFAQFASVANLAHRARVTLEEAEAAVKCLESPDANSSDPDNEGRRIERVHGGWIVLNCEKYRVLVTRAVAQEKTRQRVARFRANKRAGCNAHVTPANGSVTPSGALANAGSAGASPAAGTGELPLDVPPPPPIDVPYATIIADFHDLCPAFPRITKLSDARKRAMRSRYVEALSAGPADQSTGCAANPIEWFRTLFRKAQASDLLAGRKKDWRAGFDWLLNPANCLKVLEGNYDNGSHANHRPTNSRGFSGQPTYDGVTQK